MASSCYIDQYSYRLFVLITSELFYLILYKSGFNHRRIARAMHTHKTCQRDLTLYNPGSWLGSLCKAVVFISDARTDIYERQAVGKGGWI